MYHAPVEPQFYKLCMPQIPIQEVEWFSVVSEAGIVFAIAVGGLLTAFIRCDITSIVDSLRLKAYYLIGKNRFRSTHDRTR